MTRITERGHGRPIVVVPGIQGRCEWGLPTVEALARHGRVLTYSLADEPSSGSPWTDAAGFENYLTQLADVLRATNAVDPVLVGISYGGLVAAEFVARHPGQASALVVASAPPPSWRLPDRMARYLKAPRLLAPLFWLGAPVRVYPELRTALPNSTERWRLVRQHGRTMAAAPVSTARMARRLRWLAAAHFSTDRPIDLPALIVTGEPGLERVVPPADTLRYQHWMRGARVVTLAGTGHCGTVTRATAGADAVAGFLGDTPVARRAAAPAAVFPSEMVRAH